jgi:S1-C subfamily serine protease
MTGRRRWGTRPGLVLWLLGLGLLLVPAPAGAQRPPDLGWLGISIAEVGEDLADRLALTFGPATGTGVLVVDVLKGGPAERAPLKRGDVIVKVDAQPIWDVRQLQRVIRAQPVNQRVVLTVLREASRVTLPVIVGPMPLEARAQLAGERFGFLVKEEERRDPFHGQTLQTGRILVAFVDRDSPAFRAGLRPQDVILEINDQPVQNLQEFDQVLQRSDRALSLVVERSGEKARIPLSLELPPR